MRSRHALAGRSGVPARVSSRDAPRSRAFFALSGDPDVVGHEINHGFTSFHSNLTYAGMSGGLNESFSDIAGTMVEFFIEGATADFDLGRDIFKGNAALRYMCNPTQDGGSIDHASSYTSNLDVHYSSGVMNKAFCRAARRLSSGSLTGAAGSIQSPNYPAAYGNNATHTWCIQPSSGQPATLTFDAFDTEAGYDYVTIVNAAGTQVSKTAGTTAPAPATSTRLVVTFTSDGGVTATGFHAAWTTGATTNAPPTPTGRWRACDSRCPMARASPRRPRPTARRGTARPSPTARATRSPRTRPTTSARPARWRP